MKKITVEFFSNEQCCDVKILAKVQLKQQSRLCNNKIIKWSKINIGSNRRQQSRQWGGSTNQSKDDRQWSNIITYSYLSSFSFHWSSSLSICLHAGFCVDSLESSSFGFSRQRLFLCRCFLTLFLQFCLKYQLPNYFRILTFQQHFSHILSPSNSSALSSAD